MGRSQQVPRGDRAGFGADADDTGCPILHVDMDAFFASVEVRRRPELWGRPVIVGGIGTRGVVSSASYAARRFGVRSAMPSSRARRLCPQAVFLPPDFAEYSRVSRAVMQIFQEFTPLVEPLSLDEAFLDVSGARRLCGPPVRIAALIRARVSAAQGITCSVGVASSKFIAKLASTGAKPDGLAVVPADRVLAYLHPLPVAALWGVGDRAAETLRRRGVFTVRDLAEAPLDMLRSALGEAAAVHLHALATGHDPRPVVPDRIDKSVGAETTFEVDVHDQQVIRRTLLALSGTTASRLRKAGLAGRTVSIKVRLADFHTITRSRTLPGGTDVANEIFQVACSLLQSLHPVGQVRLLGVRVEGLACADELPRQLALGARVSGWREAERAAATAVARFGATAVRPASLLGEDQDTARRSGGRGGSAERR